MSISITNFLQAIDNGNGPALSSHFKVNFVLPSALISSASNFTPGSLSIMAQNVTIAGVQLATTELGIYGTPVKMPYGLVYQDLNVSFICTNDMAQKIIFDEWRRLIVDPTTNFVGYYDTYVGEVEVHKLDQEGNITHTVYYEEAFPLAIFEQELNSGGNEVLRLSVQMSYRRSRTIYDYNASDKANTGDSGIPPSAGEETNPNDIFRNQTVHKVPKFTP